MSMAFAKNTFGLTINEDKPSFLRPQVSLDSSDVLLFSGVHHKKSEEDTMNQLDLVRSKTEIRVCFIFMIWFLNFLNF